MASRIALATGVFRPLTRPARRYNTLRGRTRSAIAFLEHWREHHFLPTHARRVTTMARRILVVAVLLLGGVFNASPVRAADQEKIQQAIDRGVGQLKSLQNGDGSWPTH